MEVCAAAAGRQRLRYGCDGGGRVSGMAARVGAEGLMVSGMAGMVGGKGLRVSGMAAMVRAEGLEGHR